MAGANGSLERECVGGRDKGTCSVCGEMASGFHYGTVTCLACKTFFENAVTCKIEYKCSAWNQCKISTETRLSCIACKFNKCIRIGMIKERVSLYKVRGGRRESPLLTPLSDLVGREVRLTVEWAKQIPGFTELGHIDQILLIKTSWAEILSLNLAYGSMPHSGHLYFDNYYILGAKHGKALHAEELFSQCFQVVERLDFLQISRDEYDILKALVLVNSDVLLEDGAAMRRMRELLLIRLHDCVNEVRSNSLQHVSNLLLCLPLLRQVGVSVRRFWTNVHRERRVIINEFLVELLGT